VGEPLPHPIGPIVSEENKLKFHPLLFLATVAMLVGGLDCRTQFYKRDIIAHVLSNPIKPICLGYFSEILFVEE
jgi:hypothetical protein